MAYNSKQILENWLNPDFKFYVNRKGAFKEREKFLLKNENMKGEYLGACLNYVRWEDSKQFFMKRVLKKWSDLLKLGWT